jgi:hypothetical protein
VRGQCAGTRQHAFHHGTRIINCNKESKEHTNFCSGNKRECKRSP